MADFGSAIFRRSTFIGAKLMETLFTSTDLRCCSFIKADMANANLYDAKLQNAIISHSQRDSWITSERAILPKKFR